MTTTRRHVAHSIVAGFALSAILMSSGCKTDQVAGPTRVEDDAPITSLEHPRGIELPTIPVANRTEVDLVEEMILHRAMYARYLRVLATFYSEHGNEEKATWARRELNDLRRVKPYRYIEDAIVPVASLRPLESIAEADRLFEEARELMRKGGHGTWALYHQDTMKLALAKLNELVERYPTSDKIAEAAFYIAEIHKEYFEESDNRIAVLWYQRALEWDPNIQRPARFQMAVVYDYRLHEREKALAMYQRVIEEEPFNRSNVRFAHARVRQLTTERTRHAAGEPIPDGRPVPIESREPVSEGEFAGSLPHTVRP